MRAKDAIILIDEIHKLHRYWLPNEEQRHILEDIDWALRVDHEKTLGPALSSKLQEFYRLAQEATQ